VSLKPAELIAAAHQAGRPAAERSTLYEIRRRFEPRSLSAPHEAGPVDYAGA
jgi:FO synthase